MITPTIYNWPAGIIPSAALFHAGGQAIDGGLTASGALVQHPEPGGRAVVDMSFNYIKEEADRRLAGWLYSKAANRNVFRFRLPKSLQLVSPDDLGVTSLPTDYEDGLPWSDGSSFSDGTLWDFDMLTEAAATAVGSSTIIIDMTGYEHGLAAGHVIGHADRAYLVEDITYDGDQATIQITPPLRVAIETGDYVTFRPRMLGIIQDVGAFRGLFEYGFLMRPGSVRFVEALL